MQSSETQTTDTTLTLQLHASLLDWLQSQDNEYLISLLAARADVLYTLPHSTAELAHRLLTQRSLHLTLFHLNSAEIAYLMNTPTYPDDMTSFIPALVELAVIWPQQQNTPIAAQAAGETIYSRVNIEPLLHKLSYSEKLFTQILEPAPVTRTQEQPDAISSIANLVYICERILLTIDSQSLRLTQKNTISLQAWKKFSKLLGHSLAETGWLIEILYSLNLLYIEHDPLQPDQRFLARNREKIRTWNDSELIIKWYQIAQRAIALPRSIWRINNQPTDSKESIPPLSPQLSSQLHERDVRLPLVLEAFTALPENYSFTELMAGITWYRPYVLLGVPTDSLQKICAFLDFLGITSGTQLTNFGALLCTARPEEVTQRLIEQAPAPVHNVIVQSTGSIIVPGIPSAQLYQTLLGFSELESGGMGAHFRISAPRIIQSLKNHISIDSLLESLCVISETPIPDSISSLFHDCARTINRIVIGSAKSYVQCDDPLYLTTLLHHPDIQVHITRLTPNIATSPLPPELLSQIFQLHSFDAFIHEDKPDLCGEAAHSENTTSVQNPISTSELEPLTPKLREKILAAIQAIEDGDMILSATTIDGTRVRFDGSKLTLQAGMNLVREAIAEQHTIKVDYISLQGKRQSRIFIPYGLHQGRISFHDNHSTQLQEIAIHRITQIEQVIIKSSK